MAPKHAKLQILIPANLLCENKNQNPPKNDQIWFVVVLERCFVRQPPAQDDHFWVVPRVVVLYSLTVLVNWTEK